MDSSSENNDTHSFENDEIIDYDSKSSSIINIHMEKNNKFNDDNSSSSYTINKIHPNGYLQIVTGCMFSGKTSHIIKETKKWKSIGKKVLTINYHLDLRYSDSKIVSHDNFGIDCMMVDEIDHKVNKLISKYDVIIINEAQFFDNLKVNVIDWVDNYKKIVIVSGLDGDFNRNKFGEILDLIPFCDEFIKLKAFCALCKDGTPALFSLKTKSLDKLIDIGTDQYIPVCRKHYLSKSSITKTIIKND
jgi:thymidine kinase